MSVNDAFAVKELEAAKDWYAKRLGRQPDNHPMGELYEWKFSAGGCLQIFSDKTRAGKSSVTLVVNDFEGCVNDLKADPEQGHTQ